MFKRLIFIALLIPAVALADDNQLGPTNDNSGPSKDTSQLLQPASPTTSQSLQSADATEGGIPQVSNNSSLQGAGGQTDLGQFAGPDTSQHQSLDSGTAAAKPRPWWLPVGVVAVAVFIWFSEQRRPNLPPSQ